MTALPGRIATLLEQGGRGEDRLVVEQVDGRDVLAVADGAGGTGAGGAAAELACAQIIAVARCQERGPNRWIECLCDIDRAILDSACGGETTAVVVEAAAGWIRGASVGDSAAWLFTETDLIDLTADQHRKPLMGSGRAEPVGFAVERIAGTLLLASDGLFDYAPVGEIARIVRTARIEDVAARLAERVRLRSGALPDDVAIVVVEV